jgi:hypothetical protein
MSADRAGVKPMSRKKKPESEIPNPLVVDEAEFTDVVRKMVNTEPVTREDVEKRHKRRKNPEPSLRGTKKSLFDVSPMIRVENPDE